jgi:AcrR family transcriptional regulator
MAPATRPQVREHLLAAARAELAEHGRAAISLRAVARRAGLSHASPKYHFGDRSGLLTAIATEGFHALAHRLSEVHESDARHQLAVLGRAYVDFGLSHPAPKLALISWALVHGLVVLTRDGALQAAATPPATDSAELAHTLADLFTRYVSADLTSGKTNGPPETTAR